MCGLLAISVHVASTSIENQSMRKYFEKSCPSCAVVWYEISVFEEQLSRSVHKHIFEDDTLTFFFSLEDKADGCKQKVDKITQQRWHEFLPVSG